MNKLRACFLFSALYLVAVHALCLGRLPAGGGDETYWSPTAYRFASSGVFASPMMPTPAMFHVQDYLPPILTLLMSLAYKTIGFGLPQTKLVTICAGALSALLLWVTVRRLTRDEHSAALVTLFYTMNAFSVYVWQHGRPEPVVVLFQAAAIFLAVSLSPVTPIRGLQLVLIGALCAISALTYYKYLPVSVTTMILLWACVAKGDRQRSAADFFYIVFGYLIPMITFGVYALSNWKIFMLQILNIKRASEYYFGLSHLNGLLLNLKQEYLRYAFFWRDGLGLFCLAVLFFSALYFIIKLKTARKTGQVLFWSIFLWMMTLLLDSSKSPGNLYPVFLPGSLLAGLMIHEADRSAVARWGKKLVWIAILAGGIEIFVVGMTVWVQKEGRSYHAMQEELRTIVPTEARVAYASVAWYALAGRNREFFIISQFIGHPVYSQLDGSYRLKDRNYLREFDYIVVRPDELLGSGFPVEAANKDFILKKRIRLPFQRLPWSTAAPYDVDVYKRRS